MSDVIISIYFFMVFWLAPWVIILIYQMYKFNKLNKKLERFIDENLDDDKQELRDLNKKPLGIKLNKK